MRYFRAILASLIAGLLAVPVWASHVHHTSTKTSTHRSRKLAVHHRSHQLHGQQSIDPERVTQIQQALIHEHYLTGDPSGQWDSSTIAAMQKYQAAQGWQTKLMPDSRAIKKLGLGPDYSNALNAKNSNFADPSSASTSTNTIPSSQNEGFAAASGVNQ